MSFDELFSVTRPDGITTCGLVWTVRTLQMVMSASPGKEKRYEQQAYFGRCSNGTECPA